MGLDFEQQQQRVFRPIIDQMGERVWPKVGQLMTSVLPLGGTESQLFSLLGFSWKEDEDEVYCFGD